MRKVITALNSKRAECHHPGLLLQRYLDGTLPDHNKPQERRALFNAAINASRADSLQKSYAEAFQRWLTSFQEGEPYASTAVKTRCRLILGLSTQNVLETGLRLHHNFGVPIIPGSALKGLASHYCHQAWGGGALPIDQEVAVPDESLAFRRNGEFHDAVFGKTDDGGLVVFHDAWIEPESLRQGSLHLDVMTPHHPQWQLNEAPPTDFDSPIPITFLSVTGTFKIHLSWNDSRQEHAAGWLERTRTLLLEALDEWGIGGKTSSGYGRMIVESATAKPAGPIEATGPIYQKGDKLVAVQKTVSNKVKFVADDGCVGSVLQGSPPQINDGESLILRVVRIEQKNKKFPYVFQYCEQDNPPVK